MEIIDKVVLITGAGSGIGRALAQRFVTAGARAVVCTDLDKAAASATATALGDRATSRGLDVADEDALIEAIAATQARFGALDIMVSNAGYGRAGGLDLATKDWEHMMNVHAWSHLNAARAAIPGMVARGGGYFLHTASAAGLLTQMDSGPYAVSKHAAVAFAEWLLINYADQGIGVSVLCPQAVRTNILAKALARTNNSSRPASANATGAKIAGASKSRQAAADGILEPETVADECLAAIEQERFLVLPHPEVATYFKRKANDYDRWLAGMRRFRRKLMGGAGK